MLFFIIIILLEKCIYFQSARDTRSKRSGGRFKPQYIQVPQGAKLQYRDGVIMISKDNIWLYKFNGIRVLQTFNRIEGYLTHYGSAKGYFLGFGKYTKTCLPTIYA